ncbi:MAG: hypothetical protein AAB842_01340 [Patescibacteria group bacterium]
MPRKQSIWEAVILEVLEKHSGIATLKNFYEEVPPQIKKTKTTDAKHDIRGFLTRLKNVKKQIKQTGLSTYALLDVKVENDIKFITIKSVFDDYRKLVLENKGESLILK